MAMAGVTLGTVITFVGLNKNFTQPITQVSMQINFVVNAAAGAQRVFDLMDQDTGGGCRLCGTGQRPGRCRRPARQKPQERTNVWAWKHPHKADGTVTYTKLEGGVVFDDVDFGYDPRINWCCTTSACGQSRGRKSPLWEPPVPEKPPSPTSSTGFYDIADGKIRYDGININKIKKPDLRRSLGIVLQDTHLFTGTVMENIRYGNLDAT